MLSRNIVFLRARYGFTTGAFKPPSIIFHTLRETTLYSEKAVSELPPRRPDSSVQANSTAQHSARSPPRMTATTTEREEDSDVHLLGKSTYICRP